MDQFDEKIFLQFQKWPKIDLFDFTIFFGLDFFQFSGAHCDTVPKKSFVSKKSFVKKLSYDNIITTFQIFPVIFSILF